MGQNVREQVWTLACGLGLEAWGSTLEWSRRTLGRRIALTEQSVDQNLRDRDERRPETHIAIPRHGHAESVRETRRHDQNHVQRQPVERHHEERAWFNRHYRTQQTR